MYKFIQKLYICDLLHILSIFIHIYLLKYALNDVDMKHAEI